MDGVAALFHAVAKMPTLTHVSVGFADLGPRSAQTVGPALQQATQVLDCYVPIGPILLRCRCTLHSGTVTANTTSHGSGHHKWMSDSQCLGAVSALSIF